MRLERHAKVWGGEIWLVNTDRYCGKILELKKDYTCSYHYHKKKDETFYVLSGRVFMILDGERMVLSAGDVQRVRPGQKHSFAGIEDSKIIEFSTHHEEEDSYRLDKSRFKPVTLEDLTGLKGGKDDGK